MFLSDSSRENDLTFQLEAKIRAEKKYGSLYELGSMMI